MFGERLHVKYTRIAMIYVQINHNSSRMGNISVFEYNVVSHLRCRTALRAQEYINSTLTDIRKAYKYESQTLTDFSVKGAVKIPPMLLAARDVTEPPQLEVAYKARHILVLAYNYNQA